MKTRSLAVLGLVMAVLMTNPTGAMAGHDGHLVYGPGSSPKGVSYEAWARRFGRYLFAPPVSESPLANPSCDAISARGGVLFMPVATSEGIVDRCTVPSDRPLLVSPAGQFGVLGFDADTRAGVERVVRHLVPSLHDIVVKVDGHRVSHIRRFLVSSWFGVDVGSDNIFGAPAGKYHIFLTANMVMVRGLDPGRHTIWLGDVFTDSSHTDQVATIKFVLHVKDD
jgi:hypothetical protein